MVVEVLLGAVVVVKISATGVPNSQRRPPPWSARGPRDADPAPCWCCRGALLQQEVPGRESHRQRRCGLPPSEAPLDGGIPRAGRWAIDLAAYTYSGSRCTRGMGAGVGESGRSVRRGGFVLRLRHRELSVTVEHESTRYRCWPSTAAPRAPAARSVLAAAAHRIVVRVPPCSAPPRRPDAGSGRGSRLPVSLAPWLRPAAVPAACLRFALAPLVPLGTVLVSPAPDRRRALRAAACRAIRRRRRHAASARAFLLGCACRTADSDHGSNPSSPASRRRILQRHLVKVVPRMSSGSNGAALSRARPRGLAARLWRAPRAPWCARGVLRAYSAVIFL